MIKITAATAAAAAAIAAAQRPPRWVRPPGLTLLPDPPKQPRIPLQSNNFATAYTILENRYRHRPDAVVLGATYVCKEPSTVRSSPYSDLAIAFGMPYSSGGIIAANGYAVSELGKPPDFVLDIGYLCTDRSHYAASRDAYAAMGVPEYWRFDYAEGGFRTAALVGDRLTAAGKYEPIPITRTPAGLYRGYSAALGLELHWYNCRLRFGNPATRAYLPDISELSDQVDAIRASTAAIRAEREAIRSAQDATAARRSAESHLREVKARLSLPE